MRRSRIVLVSLSTAIAAIIIGILLLGQTTPQSPTVETPNQETPLDQTPDTEIPKNLFVVPEVPFGTIAVLVAMLSALLILWRRSEKRFQRT